MAETNETLRRLYQPTVLHFNRVLTDLARTDRALLTTGPSAGVIWHASDWRWLRTRQGTTCLELVDEYAGTLSWGPFVFRCDLPSREVYLSAVTLKLPTREVTIGRRLDMHSAIYDRSEFVDGPWWADLARWVDRDLSGRVADEQRRRELLAREAAAAADRTRALALISVEAEYAAVVRAGGVT